MTETPRPTESASPEPGPTNGSITSVPDALASFYGWSPDGKHFIATTSRGLGIFDLSGAQVASIAAPGGYWISSNSVAAMGPGIGHVRFYDLSGTKTGEIPADFVGLEVAADAGVFAAIRPATGSNAIGTTYRVWDGEALSKVRDGVPVAWSPDASKLAVLVPLHGPGNGPPGLLGNLSVVDNSGMTLFELTDWTSDAHAPFGFSPDGRYLAACFEDTGGGLPTMRVVDMETEFVSDSAGTCGYASWTADDTLYSSILSEGTHTWTPSHGVTDAGFPPQTVAVASTDGKIASWSASSAGALRVTLNSETTEYRLSGKILYVYWSPAETTLVAVSASPTNPSSYELTIIVPDNG